MTPTPNTPVVDEKAELLRLADKAKPEGGQAGVRTTIFTSEMSAEALESGAYSEEIASPPVLSAERPELPLHITEDDKRTAIVLCNSGGILVTGVLAEHRVAELLVKERGLYAALTRAETAEIKLTEAHARIAELETIIATDGISYAEWRAVADRTDTAERELSELRAANARMREAVEKQELPYEEITDADKGEAIELEDPESDARFSSASDLERQFREYMAIFRFTEEDVAKARQDGAAQAWTAVLDRRNEGLSHPKSQGDKAYEKAFIHALDAVAKVAAALSPTPAQGGGK